MGKGKKILRAVLEMKAQLEDIRRLNDRVGQLEGWQVWLKGGWAALMATCAWLCKGTFGNK